MNSRLVENSLEPEKIVWSQRRKKLTKDARNLTPIITWNFTIWTYHPSKIITFRDLKSINEEELKYDLYMAPWHVGDIFYSIEDKYGFWDSLLNYVLDEHAPFKKLRYEHKTSLT